MKNFIFFIGFLAFVTVSINGWRQSALNEVFVAKLKKCTNKDMEQSSQTFGSACRLEDLNDKNVACLFHCAMKSLGIIQDGKFDLTFFVNDIVQKHQFDEETKEALVRRMDGCKKKAEQEADECLRSGILAACIKPFIK